MVTFFKDRISEATQLPHSREITASWDIKSQHHIEMNNPTYYTTSIQKGNHRTLEYSCIEKRQNLSYLKRISYWNIWWAPIWSEKNMDCCSISTPISKSQSNFNFFKYSCQKSIALTFTWKVNICQENFCCNQIHQTRAHIFKSIRISVLNINFQNATQGLN